MKKKFEKPSRKHYENLKNNWSVLNICWNFEKNLKKMKIYKNVDETREKVKKLLKKY